MTTDSVGSAVILETSLIFLFFEHLFGFLPLARLWAALGMWS